MKKQGKRKSTARLSRHQKQAGLQNPRSHLQGICVGRERLKRTTEQLFSRQFIRRVLSNTSGNYRDRILGVDVIMLAVLNLVLSNIRSFLEVVDRLKAGLIPDLHAVKVSRAAFYKRLKAVSHTVFLKLLCEITKALAVLRKHKRAWVVALAPFANGIYAIDDTTLDALMRRTKALKKFKKGDMATLGGRLGCAFDLVTGAFVEILYDSNSEANEKNHIRPLVERLPVGAMYVFDLGYFAFPFFDYLTEHFCYFVSRLRKKTSYKIIQTLAEGQFYRDSIIYLGSYRSDRAAHPVRLVELLISGTWYSYITNVLDPCLLTPQQIWALYGQRWTIEMAFAALKRALSMAFLHPCHENGMLIQIWCTFALFQVLQDLRLEIAAENNWKEDDVSWYNMMNRIGWYAENPSNKGTLRTWLVTNAELLNLKKRGLRIRRLENLPTGVLQECQQIPAMPDLYQLKSRKPCQSKPEPRKKHSKIIVGGLS